MVWTQEKIDEVYAMVSEKASSDAEFQKELLEDPRLAIARIAGVELPEGFQIKIVENAPKYTITFSSPLPASGELSEDALDFVVGGYSRPQLPAIIK